MEVSNGMHAAARGLEQLHIRERDRLTVAVCVRSVILLAIIKGNIERMLRYGYL